MVETNILDLNGLFEPDRPPRHDNDTRVPEEVHVYQIRARLVKFKLEGGDKGDRDYHLVVSDDTLKFTENTGQNGGHSVVAEIVRPECIAGMRGDPAVGSRLTEQIKQARHTIENKFAVPEEGKWVDARGVPVRIVGVGFFDRPHGQIGRALNNLERPDLTQLMKQAAAMPQVVGLHLPQTHDSLLPESPASNDGNAQEGVNRYGAFQQLRRRRKNLIYFPPRPETQSAEFGGDTQLRCVIGSYPFNGSWCLVVLHQCGCGSIAPKQQHVLGHEPTGKA